MSTLRTTTLKHGGSTVLDNLVLSNAGETRFCPNSAFGVAALYVDGQTNRVGVNTETPGVTLDVNGNVNFTGNTVLGGTLDVTGNVVFSGTLNVTGDLVVDTDTLFVDATNDRVGIGTSSPGAPLDVNGIAYFASNVLIGDTLPASPDISLNADGTAEFASTVTATSSGGKVTEINGDPNISNVDVGNLHLYCPTANVNQQVFRIFSDVGGIGQGKLGITADGRATFAADATINEVIVGKGAGNVESNTVLGKNALGNNTTGRFNTAVGLNALEDNTEGRDNTAIGVNAVRRNTTGEFNTGVGQGALENNILGSLNTAVGRQAGYFFEGDSNTILGAYAGTAADATLNSTVIISAGTTERMRIDSNGNTRIFNTTGSPVNNSVVSPNLIIGANAWDTNTGSNPYFLEIAPTAEYGASWGYGRANIEFTIQSARSAYRYNFMTASWNGDVTFSGAISKGSGSFKIKHPLPEKEETHYLVHSFIEGPQADLIYRGHVQLIDGQATVNIDEAGRMSKGTFEALCSNVCCFTSNESDWTSVRGSVSGNILTIESEDPSSTSHICWMVVGERKDPHMIETSWTDENGRIITEPLQSSLTDENGKLIMEPFEGA